MQPNPQKADQAAPMALAQGNAKSVGAIADVIHMDESKPLRFGWTVLLVGFVGFMLWAAFVPLDQGATLNGTVIVSGNTKTIQHPFGGVVDNVLVKDGDAVKAGQVLVKFNDTRSDSALEVVRTQWITAKAIQNRLQAELSGFKPLEFDPWLTAHPDDQRVRMAVGTQRSLYESRRSAFTNQIKVLQESEGALQSALVSMKQSLAQKQAQVKFSQSQIDGLRLMASEGYIAQNRLLEAERSNSAVSGSLSDDYANIARTEGQLAEVRQRIALARSEFLKEAQTQMTEIQRQVDEGENRLRSADYDNRYSELKSPVDGVVTNVQVFSQGAVVQAGAPVLSVVPQGEALEINGQVPTTLIDKVRRGTAVTISFPAFNLRTTPNVQGQILTVGADAVVDQRSGLQFYTVKVKVNENDMTKLAGLELQPGMPATMLVKTGERSLLNYLVRPVIDHMGSALKEE